MIDWNKYDPYLTSGEVVECGIKRHLIDELLSTGRLTCEVFGGCRRFHKGTVRRFVERGEQGPMVVAKAENIQHSTFNAEPRSAKANKA